MTYSFNGMSARANSPSNNNYSKYEGSGVNNLLFGSNNEFVIGKITLDAAQKNLCLTFGSYLSEYGASDNAFDASKFHVSLSKDGDNWVEITYDRPVADDEHSQYGTWALATANFTLKEVPAELYIKFNADIASSYRMDDVTLLEGVGGQEVDLNYVAPTTGAKIGEIKTAGKYKTAGTVVARGKLAYIIADETGAMMVYHNGNERAVGDKISIEGEVTIYNEDSTPQFSEDAVVTVESTGNAWTYNPTVCDASAMDQLLSVDPVCTEIQFTGTLSIDGNYVNVAIDGASKAIGSVKYIDNTTISDLDDAVVVVKGYFVGTSSGKYVNVLPYSIEAAGEVPPSITVNPTSLTFAAAGEAKTVTVTKKNADDCTIEASADNEQFTVEVSGDQVNVTAKENTAEEAISGTLTVKLMKAGEAVATATVKLTQSGVSSGNEQTVTLSFAGGDAQNHDEIPFSEGVISAVFAKGSHNTAPRWDADCVRFYGTSGQKNILTVSGATITKVVFNLNGSYTMEGMTADSGSFSDNVWTGSSSSVVFTAGYVVRRAFPGIAEHLARGSRLCFGSPDRALRNRRNLLYGHCYRGRQLVLDLPQYARDLAFGFAGHHGRCRLSLSGRERFRGRTYGDSTGCV